MDCTWAVRRKIWMEINKMKLMTRIHQTLAVFALPLWPWLWNALELPLLGAEARGSACGGKGDESQLWISPRRFDPFRHRLGPRQLAGAVGELVVVQKREQAPRTPNAPGSSIATLPRCAYRSVVPWHWLFRHRFVTCFLPYRHLRAAASGLMLHTRNADV